MRTKRFVIGMIVVVMALTMALGIALADKPAGKGNLAPSGKHYTLNILGKDWGIDKEPIEDCGQGHRIFVKLGEPPDSQGQGGKKERTQILLFSCEEMGYGEDCMDFGVIDCDGTDGEASLMLPDPNPGTGLPSTRYSVYVRALGKPGGIADVNVCATYYDPDADEDIVYCGDIVTLERKKGQAKKAATQIGGQGSQKFKNVSKELLTICVLVFVGYETDGVTPIYEWKRLYIFDPLLEGELWNYDNKGLKHVQMRFYPVPTDYTPGDWECP